MRDFFHDAEILLARDATIPELFAEQVGKDPDACAVVQGTRRLSYRDLDQASDKISRWLLDRGVAFGECVIVHAGRTIEMVAANLGVLKAGACYVPLDPVLPAARKRFVIEDTHARILLIDQALDIGEQRWVVDSQPYLIGDIWSFAHVRSTHFARFGSRRLAYVMYTSGSTGKPKGVMIEHRSVARLVKDNDNIPLERNARLLMTGAIGFDITAFEIWGSLLNGLSLYLADAATLNDGRSLQRALETWGITTLSGTAAFCRCRVQEDPSVFRSLKYLLIARQAVMPELSNILRRAAPGPRLINIYGFTESTVISTAFEIDDEYSSRIPIGKPISGTTVFIVDKDWAPLTDGSVGEIVLGGDGLARGYLNCPELTRARFVEVPGFGRVYRTGDLGRRLEDGNIQLIGSECARDTNLSGQLG